MRKTKYYYKTSFSAGVLEETHDLLIKLNIGYASPIIRTVTSDYTKD